MCNNSAKSSGFTLIELMITLAIAGILLAVGIPSFNSIITSNRLTTYANELVTALNLARSEAIRRGVQVTMSTGNTGGNWGSGWTIFTDSNGNGVLDGADVLLRTYPALTNGYTLLSGNNYNCWVAYNSVGLSRGSGATCNGGLSNDTFRLCDPSQTITSSRAITVNATGRARTLQGATQCP